MSNEERFHIIGVGNVEDWEAGRGSLYYIEKAGERYLPVFTTAAKVERFVEANFGQPKAHMEMLESIPVSHVEPLTSDRFIVMPLPYEGVAQVAIHVGADYLLRDPRPGTEQEVLKLPKD